MSLRTCSREVNEVCVLTPLCNTIETGQAVGMNIHASVRRPTHDVELSAASCLFHRTLALIGT